MIDHDGCDDLLAKISSYGNDATQNYAGDIPYPHNVARNAARRGVATEFVFLVDIDVMPSLGMQGKLSAGLSSISRVSTCSSMPSNIMSGMSAIPLYC